ncbi:DUF4340 domain-containing protein, partial [Anaerosporobacter sp.]|uniref:DUF4340 domain-containing protein n=1 Tax=Anaerosporobacter sp. TaxID=1872529 RepID=UPI00286FA2F4
NDSWVDKSDTNAPINQDYITAILDKLVSLEASKIVVEKAEDLAEYGLENPSVIVHILSEDGSDFELNFGDSLSSSSGYYVNLADEEVVYAVATGVRSVFEHTKTEMLSIEEFPTITASNVTNINIVKDGEEIFKAEYNQDAADAGEYYAWNIVKPYSTVQKGNPTQFDTYFENYSSVSFNECVDYICSDLSKYGLDNPSTTIDLSYYEETIVDSNSTEESSADTTTEESQTIRIEHQLTILVGNMNDAGEYYVQIKTDGRKYENAIYTISASTIENMLAITPYDYVCNLTQLVDITSLDTLKIKADGKSYELKVTPNPDKKTEETEDSEEVADSLYYYNGTKVEEKAFKNLYQELIGITTTGDIKKQVSDTTPVYEFDFIRNSDLLEDLHVEYLPYDGVNFYRVSINGEENYLVEKAAVDKVITLLEQFETE